MSRTWGTAPSWVRFPAPPLISLRFFAIDVHLAQTMGQTERSARGEDLAESVAKVLGFADVTLGRAERGVTRALFDFERIVSTDGAPRDAGCAQIVERHRFARLVARCEIHARHVGQPQATLKLPRELAVRFFNGEHSSVCARFFSQRLE